MHCLIGVFIETDKPEQVTNSEGKIRTTLYPFKVMFPQSKIRVFYTPKIEDRDRWMLEIKTVAGTANIHDFYHIQSGIGEGKFGQVRLAVHLAS